MINTNENPEALAGAIGAKVEIEAAKLQFYPANAVDASAVGRHRHATQAIGHALFAQDPESWQRLVLILGFRLTADEIAALAWASLTAARADDAQDVAHAVLGEAGPPLPPFSLLYPEAQAWAAIASSTERKAYAAAAVERMTDTTRARFLAWATGEQRNG